MKKIMVVIRGDFTDKGKAEGRKKRLLREMTQQLRQERKEHSKLEKIIFLLDTQELKTYGCINR